MKKILIALSIALCCFTLCAFGTSNLKVRAEELPTSEAVETPTTSETPTDEEIPTEEPTDQPTEDSAPETSETPPKKELTEEEINNIINSVLTEQQKSIITMISDKLSSFFNIDAKIIYLVVAGALAILLIIAVLIGKVAKAKANLKSTNAQLTAQHNAYAVLSQAKEDLETVLKNLSAEEIAKRVDDAYNKQAEQLVERVSKNVVKKLKIDDKTLSELLGNEKVIVSQETAIVEALLAIASGNKDKAIKILTGAPTVEQVGEVLLENEKLKTALGEDAVKKVLGENKGEAEEV